MAEHALNVAPDVYTVLFENDRLRVIEVRMEPGSRTEMHSHPDNLVYGLSSGKVAFTAPSGEVVELEVPAGEAMWMEATEHATEHVEGTVHALMIEPK